MGAREYDPRTGRWLQKDPIGTAAGDPNLYLYCGNDPVNFADTDGLDFIKKTREGLWVGGLLFDSEVVVEGLKTGGAATLSAFTLGLWDGGAYKNRVDFDVSYQLAGFGCNCLIGAGALKA